MRLAVISALFALAFGLSPPAAAAPVHVEGGLVEGVREGDVVDYRSIPYAAPPVGDLRWRPPAPVKSWDGVQRRTVFAPKCMQIWRDTPGYEDEPMSEDCLYLSVWAPAKPAARKLPVLVYLHGGGFTVASGTAKIYWGDELAKQGLIVVNVNYRLNVFGFLAHPELSAEAPHKTSGNYGLLDQIAALAWIQKNIAALGGDPTQVTIYGQSAGAQAIALLQMSPLAKGLFQRAIAESGGLAPPSGMDDGMAYLPAAEAQGAAFAQRIGAPTLAALRALPAAELMKRAPGRSGGYPVVDGWVLPEDPYAAFAAGRFTRMPLIAGWNAGEGVRFIQPTTPDAFERTLRERYGALGARALDVYPSDKAQLRSSQNAVARDDGFGWPVWTWARLQPASARPFVYYFSHKAPEPRTSDYAKGFGDAAHGFELNYVTGHLAQRADLVAWTPYDRDLERVMLGYWSNFAKRGDPNGPGLPLWPAFDPNAERVQHIGDTIGPGPLPDRAGLELSDARYRAIRDAAGK